MAVATRKRNRDVVKPSIPSSSQVRPVPDASCACTALIPTAWGYCGIVWKNHQSEQLHVPFTERPVNALLCRIVTPGLPQRELRQFLLALHPHSDEVLCGNHASFHPEIVPDWVTDLVQYLQSYYSKGLRDWSEPQFVANWAFWRPRLEWSTLTPFQREVLEITAEIPRGMHLTYGQVAKKLHKPQAARAVGAALGSNPWPVLIPCHRVVGSTGKMTGFSAPGGIEAKKRMLDMEASSALFA